MVFILIKGKFFIVGYQPDGNSVKLKADKTEPFTKLITDNGTPCKVKLNNKGFAKLRIEGIDALETHYISKINQHQPLQYATATAAKLFNLLGFTSVRWSEKVFEVVGANNDGKSGEII